MHKKNETFESAIKKLEEIISRLEDGDITLDKALEDFESGVKLMRVCDSYLQKADGKLKELLKGENGGYIEKTLGISMSSVFTGEDTRE